jgi:uncharacterized protein YoxC
LTADLFAAPVVATLAALLQAAPVVDAVVVREASGLERWASVLFSIATIVIAIALIVLAAAIVGAALAARRLTGKVQKMMERVRTDVDPILQHAIAVSDNVNYVSTAIRGDVQKLNDTVTMATRRLNRAAEVAENRIGEFNALLGVVQEEAENLFVNTAATVRGVQVGTETFRRFRDPEGYDPYEGDDEELLDDGVYEGAPDHDEDEDELPPPPRRAGRHRL